MADVHDTKDKKLFSTVVVISDRNVIDAQLQDALFDFQRTTGVVATIKSQGESKSGQLAEALAGGKKIIVCTIQTFPFALEEVRQLAATQGKTFAVIADEAHSSQTGEAAAKIKQVLSPGQPEPTKYWLATVEKNISFRALVDLAKMRWRVERDYLELKQEVGLGHYEGRGWPGFHHHGTLCIAVYGFLISQREMIPPSGSHCAGKLKKPAIPDSYRPRGAADPAPTSRSQLDRHAASVLDRRDRKNAAKMSILRKQIHKEQAPCFLTQYNYPKLGRRLLQRLERECHVGITNRPQHRNAGQVRHDLRQYLEPLCIRLARRLKSDARHVAARMGEALNQTKVKRRAYPEKYHGHGRGHLLCSDRAQRCPDHQQVRSRQKAHDRLLDILWFRKLMSEGYISARHVPKLDQMLLKSLCQPAHDARRGRKHMGDAPDLLRGLRDGVGWPRHRRAAKQAEDISASHGAPPEF